MGLLDFMKWKEPFNIRYEIIGREDGRWIIKAFDRNDRPLGTQISVSTPKEAWRIFMVLNGYGFDEVTEVIEVKEAS
jgi:hypothetical protein